MNLGIANSIYGCALYSHVYGRGPAAFIKEIITLFERRNLGALDDTKEGLYENGEKMNGSARGIVYSVVPLDEVRLRALEKWTGETLEKEVHLENRIDKSLVGGVMIYVEGKLIDASVKARLEAMKQRLAK